MPKPADRRRKRIQCLAKRLKTLNVLLSKERQKKSTLGLSLSQSCTMLLTLVSRVEKDLGSMLEGRYHIPRETYTGHLRSGLFDSTCKRDLNDVHSMSDTAFQHKYAMTRSQLKTLADKIRRNAVFTPASCTVERKQQAKVEYQLMVFLAYLRANGTNMNNTNAAAYFGMGCGTAQVFRTRVLRALEEELQETNLSWPDTQERKRIARAFEQLHDDGRDNPRDTNNTTKQVVGVINTVLLPLACRPRGDKIQDYKEGPARQLQQFSLVCAMVCDHQLRIRYCSTMKPGGTTHDDEMMTETAMAQKTDEMFSPGEYLLLQEGSTTSPTKDTRADNVFCPRDHNIPWIATQEDHPYPFSTFGVAMKILKKRFPFLDGGIRLIWKDNDPKAMAKIESHIRVAILLHNYLLSNVGRDSDDDSSSQGMEHGDDIEDDDDDSDMDTYAGSSSAGVEDDIENGDDTIATDSSSSSSSEEDIGRTDLQSSFDSVATRG